LSDFTATPRPNRIVQSLQNFTKEFTLLNEQNQILTCCWNYLSIKIKQVCDKKNLKGFWQICMFL